MPALFPIFLLFLLLAGQEAPDPTPPAEPDALRLLLVTPGTPARTARIRAFLAGHGIALQAARYGQVTKEACDGVDLVVADSPADDKAAFRRSMKLRRRARSFPRTAAPILAVGYLGTELLEAQGLAMASGYI